MTIEFAHVDDGPGSGPQPDEVRKRWYFTFGFAHKYADRYYIVDDATYSEARERMFATFGREWAFQYDDEHWHRDGVSQAERYRLPEVK